jgi:hypothetical protein
MVPSQIGWYTWSQEIGHWREEWSCALWYKSEQYLGDKVIPQNDETVQEQIIDGDASLKSRILTAKKAGGKQVPSIAKCSVCNMKYFHVVDRTLANMLLVLLKIVELSVRAGVGLLKRFSRTRWAVYVRWWNNTKPTIELDRNITASTFDFVAESRSGGIWLAEFRGCEIVPSLTPAGSEDETRQIDKNAARVLGKA